MLRLNTKSISSSVLYLEDFGTEFDVIVEAESVGKPVEVHEILLVSEEFGRRLFSCSSCDIGTEQKLRNQSVLV